MPNAAAARLNARYVVVCVAVCSVVGVAVGVAVCVAVCVAANMRNVVAARLHDR